MSTINIQQKSWPKTSTSKVYFKKSYKNVNQEGPRKNVNQEGPRKNVVYKCPLETKVNPRVGKVSSALLGDILSALLKIYAECLFSNIYTLIVFKWSSCLKFSNMLLLGLLNQVQSTKFSWDIFLTMWVV